MAKLNDFNLKTNNQFNTFTIDNIQVNVKKYLPVSDKIDLIQVALQKAQEDGIYNEMKLDVYFHLNIIYLYTDVEISQEDREDEMELYDILESNNIIGYSQTELKCEVTMLSAKPISFTTKLIFYDTKGKQYPIMVSGTTDNCLFTNYSFFQRNYNNVYEYNYDKETDHSKSESESGFNFIFETNKGSGVIYLIIFDSSKV